MITNLIGEIIETGADGQPITPDIVLAYRSGEKIGVINNVDAFVNSRKMIEVSEISFDVHKMVNDEINPLWDMIKDFRLAFVPHIGSQNFNPWYELTVTIDENDETVKHCEGVHVQEAELSQLTLNNMEINTEDDIARDDYVVTKFYDENNPEGSLLNRLLHDKGSHYSIYHVDASLANIQRTFSWDGDTIKEALDEIAEEVECLFVYGESLDDDGLIHRTISAYDLNDVCLDCGKRGNFVDGVCTNCGSTNIKSGYGEYSGIFLNHENFTENINYTSNADDVKNCFRMVGGDDMMTATIRNINPNGSQYIWYLSDEMRADMSPALQAALADYDEEYDTWQKTATIPLDEDLIDAYNTLIDKYTEYDETLEEIEYPVIGYPAMTNAYYQALDFEALLQTTLAPVSAIGTPTTAAEEAAKLTSQLLSPIGVQNADTVSLATANSAIINYAKVYIDTSKYGLSVESSSLANQVWTGVIRVKSYIDDEDTALTNSLTIMVSGDPAEYTRCLLEKAMKRNGADATGVVELFKMELTDFEDALENYSVDNLEILASVCRSCLDVMIEQGIATPGTSTWGNMYDSIYLPYFAKNQKIEEALIEREAEVKTVHDLLMDIDSVRKSISSELDMKDYLGDTLWSEFCSYRRDDEYKNDNFVSDGLTDKELIERANDFVDVANRELIKAATLQHTISCNLSDILLVREIKYSDLDVYGRYELVINGDKYVFREDDTFSPLLSKFEVGNWIIIEVDEKIYRLRLISYVISYDDLTTIDIEFSDVTYGLGSVSDVSDILSRAKSMATSYNSVKHQASKGDSAERLITSMVDNGLSLTNNKIVNSAVNQNMVIDGSGMLMRQQNEYDDAYSPEQTKIINRGFYYTTDNWQTVQTGLGRYLYYDPIVGDYVEDYGLIARKIVGQIVIGNDLTIYNTSGSFSADSNGVIITSSVNDDNSNVFTIQRDNGDGTITKYLYVAQDGSLHLGADTFPAASVTVYPVSIDMTEGTAELGAVLYVNGNVTQPSSYTWTGGTSSEVLSTDPTLIISDLDENAEQVYNCIVVWDDNFSQTGSYDFSTLTKAQSDINSINNRIDNELAPYTSDYDTLRSFYLDFDPNPDPETRQGGLRIGGKTDDGESPFYTQIDNTEMGFYEGGNKIAYINGQKYYIHSGEIVNSLTMYPFEWRVEENALNLVML